MLLMNANAKCFISFRNSYLSIFNLSMESPYIARSAFVDSHLDST